MGGGGEGEGGEGGGERARSLIRRKSFAGAFTGLPPPPSLRRSLRQASIFATTYNMGESSAQTLASQLPLWIPQGYDCYIIGLQECLELEEVRAKLWDYLGGPQCYTVFSKVGSPSTVLLHGRP